MRFFKMENSEAHYPNFIFILWRHVVGDNIPFPPSYCNDEEMYWQMIFREFDKDTMGNELETYGIMSYDLNKQYLKTLLNMDSYHISLELIPLEVIAYNQAVLRKEFPSGFVTLYRGIDKAKKINKFIDYTETHETIWTDSLGVAKMFKGKGMVLETVVDIKNVLVSHYGSSLLWSGQEYEFIVKRGAISGIGIV